MVGVDHELCGDRGAVRAGSEVGDVSLQPGQSSRFGFQSPVDPPGAAGELDEPVAFDRGLARDGLLRLGDLLVDTA